MFTCALRLSKRSYPSQLAFMPANSRLYSTKSKKKEQKPNKTKKVVEEARQVPASVLASKRPDQVSTPVVNDRFVQLVTKGIEQDGKLRAATESFHLALSLDDLTDKNKAEVHYHLGTVHEDSMNIEKAIFHYSQATKLDPTDAISFYHLGVIYQNGNNLQDALKNYQKAVKLDPTLIEAWVNLGNVLEDLGRSSEAVEMYKKAITVEPVLEDEEDEKGLAHRNLALSYLDNNQEELAMKHLDTAVMYNQADSVAHSYIGELREKAGDPTLALESYKTALKINPRESAIYAKIGDLYLQTENKDYKEAVKHYTVAMTLNPAGHKDLNYIVGWLHYSLDNEEAAKNYLLKAITIEEDENLVPAYIVLGSIFSRTDPEAALKYFGKAVELGCEFAEVFESMAVCYSKIGDRKEAIKHLKHSIKITPDAPHLYGHLGAEMLKYLYDGYTPVPRTPECTYY